MDPTTAKITTAAFKHRKDGQKFLAAVLDTKDGVVSADSQELAEHVDEHFDGHAESGKAIVEGFKKASERITDNGENVDDGFVEDSAEVLVCAVENVANSEEVQHVGEVAGSAIEVVHDALREGVKKETEVVHGAARAVVTPEGLPDIEGAEERAERYAETIETQAEGVAHSAAKAFDAVKDKAPVVLNAVDPCGALEAVEEVGETAVEALGEAVVEEAVETVAGSAPFLGVVIPSYYLLHGAAKTAAGATSLVAAGAMTLVGGVYGAAAAPFDGGASWGKVANTSRGISLWGASVGAEGGLIAAKGAMGFADQVPGSQLATVPAKMACKMGANSINQMRNSSRGVDFQGVDDFEGVITEEMVRTGTAYEIFSADGKRLLRASGIKSSRCIKGAYRLHSEVHGGNTLFFLGICYPAEWVVWDVPGKTDGEWERLELRWREGGKKFTISGHGGQHVRWKDSDGFFRGTRSESKATEFVLKEIR